MWYNFDTQRFGVQMLPPILRGRTMLALVKAILTPLVWLSNRFREVRSESRERLASSGQSVSLVDALRRAYDLQEGDVYITDAEDRRHYLYMRHEAQKPLTLHKRSEATTAPIMHYSDEGRVVPDFYIHIPDFLEGEASDILRLVERYKPAGRKYQIIYYRYE